MPKAVTIIEHRHRCYETFSSSSRNTSSGFLRVASGAYLRTEVPHLCQKIGFTDEFALYTDYDVLFLKGDYSGLEVLRPQFFASCPESNREDWSFINTGVMVLNLKTFLTDDEFILEQIRRGFDTFKVWDQTLYNEFYAGRFDKLPLEYNWKPYWGVRADARIIHFHGPKPASVEEMHRLEDPSLQALRKAHPEAYDYYENAWESFRV